MLVQIMHSGNVSVSVLIDSCMAENVTEHRFIEKLQLPLQSQQHSLRVQALQGGPIRGRSVTHCNKPITIHVSAMHHECICLLVTIMTKFTLVLGFLCIQISHP